MTKGFVKRSDFLVLLITSLVTVDLPIEADEAYLTSLDTEHPVMIKRDREKQLEKLTDEHPDIENYIGMALTPSVKTSVLGESVSGVLTGSVSDFSLLVGVKETVTFGLSTMTANEEQRVLVELVHYVPADAIAA